MKREPNIVDLLAGDALATVRRMRADAAHLKELGSRAKKIAQGAARQTKARIERGLESAADAILAAEKQWSHRE